MYKKTDTDSHEVVWDPDDEQRALAAMEEHRGNGVPAHVSLPEQAAVQVNAAAARRIRTSYIRLGLEEQIANATSGSDEEIELIERWEQMTDEVWQG